MPDCAITTDIIVGFPGETEADFAQTLEVAEEVGFDGAFTFIYSPRRGTEAAAFADEFVPHEVAVERMERLVEVVQRRARERAQRFVGRTLDVLVEGTSRTRPVAAARPHAPQQGRQLHRPRRARARSSPVEITAATSQTLQRRDVAARPRSALTRPRSVRARMRTYVRCDGTINSRQAPGGAAAGLGDAVVRTFDAPEALDARFHEIHAKSALNRVPGRRRAAVRLDGQPVPGMPHRLLVLLRPARPTSTSTSTPGGTSRSEIIVKVNAPEVLRAELRRPSWQRRAVALGTNTDPYQWVEKRYGLTRAISRCCGTRATRAPC